MLGKLNQDSGYINFQQLLQLNQVFLRDKNPGNVLVFLSRQNFTELALLLKNLQKYLTINLQSISLESNNLKPGTSNPHLSSPDRLKNIYNYICQLGIESKVRTLTTQEQELFNKGFFVFNLYIHIKDMVIMEYTIHAYTNKLGIPIQNFKQNLRHQPNFPLAPEIINNFKFLKSNIEKGILNQIFITPNRVMG